MAEDIPRPTSLLFSGWDKDEPKLGNDGIWTYKASFNDDFGAERVVLKCFWKKNSSERIETEREYFKRSRLNHHLLYGLMEIAYGDVGCFIYRDYKSFMEYSGHICYPDSDSRILHPDFLEILRLYLMGIGNFHSFPNMFHGSISADTLVLETVMEDPKLLNLPEPFDYAQDKVEDGVKFWRVVYALLQLHKLHLDDFPELVMLRDFLQQGMKYSNIGNYPLFLKANQRLQYAISGHFSLCLLDSKKANKVREEVDDGLVEMTNKKFDWRKSVPGVLREVLNYKFQESKSSSWPSS